eukprot:GHRR01018094.1.p1 GENE.GHRR01018094.1~~GHRR01018094.1.p1  ORF type:complete len:133 (+),score=39.40 GHRR01018094.1:33-431(+)
MLASRASVLASRVPLTGAALVPRIKQARRKTTVCMADKASEGSKLDKSTPDEVWSKLLTAQEYHILREKGTEPPGSGKYNKFNEDGVYKCAGCGAPLYKSDTKFNSSCGWPAYYDAIPGAVVRHEDKTFGMM